MFEPPTQPSYFIVEIANVRAIMLIKQNDIDTDQEISENESEDAAESDMSSDIQKDDLDNLQEVLHLEQARRDETIRTTRVPLPEKRSGSDTVIGRT
jgi:hypothetical protein